MYSNLNPRTMGMNHHPFQILLDAAVVSGFRGIEVPAGAFDTDEAASEAREKMESIGMRFGLIMAPADMYKISDEEFADRVVEFGQWAHRARLAGVQPGLQPYLARKRPVLPTATTSTGTPPVCPRSITSSPRRGIQYGLEFMGAKTVRDQFRYPFIHSLMGVLSLADAVSPEIGFVFDTIHWYTSGSRETISIMQSDTRSGLSTCTCATQMPPAAARNRTTTSVPCRARTTWWTVWRSYGCLRAQATAGR